MKWTTDKPTEPGLYRCKDETRPHGIWVRISWAPPSYKLGGLVCHIFDTNRCDYLTAYSPDCKWAGPIEEPK